MISYLQRVLGAGIAYFNSSNVSNFLGFLGQHPQMKDGCCMFGCALFFRGF